MAKLNKYAINQFHSVNKVVNIPGGILGYKCDGGGGGGPTYFFGSKIFNFCIFLGLKNLRVFFWVRISARLIVLT